MNPTQQYKDSMLRALYKDPAKALQLYSTIKGKKYAPDTNVEMLNPEQVLLSPIRNDLAFIIDGVLVVIMEHQSSINKCLPRFAR